MRIVLVSHTYVATPYREKLTALAAQPGTELTLVAPRTWRHALRAIPFSAAECDVGYKRYTLPVYLNGRNGRFMFPWLALARILKREKPHILHIEEEPLSLSAFQLMLLNRLTAKARVVIFTWENLFFEHGPIRRLIESYNLSHADFLIAGNSDVREVMIRKGAPEDRIRVVPQIGVTPGANQGYPFHTERQTFVIGFVGRLVEEKGVFTLLNAFARLPQNCRLLLVGGGEAQGDFVQTADALGVRSRIQFAGSVPHESVEDYLKTMDVLVLPSQTTPRWAEQFGHVLIEAMGLGIPVVGSDSGAIPEVISSAGMVFPEGEAEALLACLQRLIASPGLRIELGRRGWMRCMANYTNDRIAELTCDIYRSVLRGDA